MDAEVYKLIRTLRDQIPPDTKAQTGQKFQIGDIVNIVRGKSWYSKRYTPDQHFEVMHSYAQMYGASDDKEKHEYRLKHLFEDNNSAWYDEDEIDLVRGAGEMECERERAEYERLKAKFDKNKNE